MSEAMFLEVDFRVERKITSLLCSAYSREEEKIESAIESSLD
jgi:hypothetical protein